jgi:hypothetical protein
MNVGALSLCHDVAAFEINFSRLAGFGRGFSLLIYVNARDRENEYVCFVSIKTPLH